MMVSSINMVEMKKERSGWIREILFFSKQTFLIDWIWRKKGIDFRVVLGQLDICAIYSDGDISDTGTRRDVEEGRDRVKGFVLGGDICHVKCETPLEHPSKDRKYLLNLRHKSLSWKGPCLSLIEC